MLERAVMRDLGGKFRILAELGQGGSSRVWLAVARGPRGFNKLVVLKSMKDELKGEPDLAQMFLNEAKLAAQLSHPNIVQTNEVFEHDGRPVIVMEYLDGQSLAAILARNRPNGGIPLNFQLRILSEALAGLHAAHGLRDYSGLPLQVVHRDVSPHNVFVTYDGQTKVIDFGIAKLMGLTETTESGVIRGKLHYMAPEQISAGRVDCRADVYAAGVMLWEMLTGVRMWRGVNEAVVMNRVLGGQLPELLAINPGAPPRLAQMVLRATSVPVDDRYRSAADFQADIDQFLRSTSQEPRPREVGDAVARLFADRRQERQIIVERELMRVAEQSEDEYSGYRPVALTALETDAANAARAQRHQTRQRLRRSVPWLVTMILVGGLAIFLSVPESSKAGSLPAPLPGIADDGSALLPATAQLRITAFPKTAHILLDGEIVSENPFHRTVPLDPTHSHDIEVVALEHEPQKRTLFFDRDQELIVTLSPLGPGAQPSAPASMVTKRAAPAKRSRTPSSQPVNADAPAPAPVSECEPPYFFDQRGVKKFKAGCL
jgi:serine/threonine protein kinase